MAQVWYPHNHTHGYIHEYIYAYIDGKPGTPANPIQPGHGNRRNSRTSAWCGSESRLQSGQTSLLQCSDKKNQNCYHHTRFLGSNYVKTDFAAPPLTSLNELTALRQTPSLVGCGRRGGEVERKGRKKGLEWIKGKVRRTLNSIWLWCAPTFDLGYATGCLSVAYKTLFELGTV